MQGSRFFKVLKPKLKDLAFSIYLLKRNRLTSLAMYVIVLLVLIAVFAPMFFPPVIQIDNDADPSDKLLAPSWEHLFGTDELGRDICIRVILGTRISLLSAAVAIVIAITVGIALGAIAGYCGGLIDESIMRFTDLFLAFPPLLLAMVIAAFLGPNLENAMLAIAVCWWPTYTRIIRGQAVSIRERQFVKAAEALGAPVPFIITRHIIPNCIAPIIVQVSMDFGSIILMLASLSFLGLGAQAPTPEWGLMVSTSRSYFLNAWWYVFFPGLAIFLTVLCFNLVGDGLREILDPKTRKN